MPEWLTNIPLDFWLVLGQMAPYLLFGFLVAGLLFVLIRPEFVERQLGGRGVWPVVKAAAFGVPLPICSCGVIPVGASIRRHGASKGATTAFLISTPQTGVDSILATFSLLGPIFAVYRPVAALISGVIGGMVVSAAESSDQAPGPSEKCQDPCCAPGSKRNRAGLAITYGFVTLPRDIGRTLLVGLAAAALISAIVPKGYFSTVVPPGPAQILVLMAVGIPVYICATASIPVAAGLIVAGVSPGAAFALLMTGPATNAATVATIWKVMGRRTCLIYLATMMVAALAGGLLLDQIVSVEDVQGAMHHHGWMHPRVKDVFAVVLLGVLVTGAFYRPGRGEKKDVSKEGESLKLTIKGMTCSHCISSVKRALLESPGVEAVEIDLAGGRAEISGRNLDAAELCKVVGELGYSAETGTEVSSAEV